MIINLNLSMSVTNQRCPCSSPDLLRITFFISFAKTKLILVEMCKSPLYECIQTLQLNFLNEHLLDPDAFIWKAGYYGLSSETPFKWRFAGEPLLAVIC